MTALHLEDLTVGRKFKSGRLRVDDEQIKTFATQFDPQPFHLDNAAAAGSIFGSLAASGWHTAALTMRLLVDGEFKPSGGIVGVAIDELRWPRPLRPGDELHVDSEILEVRSSQSRPDRGTVRVRVSTLNQAEAVVQSLVVTLIVPTRPTPE